MWEALARQAPKQNALGMSVEHAFHFQERFRKQGSLVVNRDAASDHVVFSVQEKLGMPERPRDTLERVPRYEIDTCRD